MIQSLEQDTSHHTLVLLDSTEEAEEVSQGKRRIVPDLGPVHTVLVSLATSLQVKVDCAILDQLEIMARLADEIILAAEMLEAAGDIELRSSLPISSLTSSMTSASSPASLAILSIHQYRDAAVSALRAQAEVLSSNQGTRSREASAEDIETAFDHLNTSIKYLRTRCKQLGMVVRTLRQYSSSLPEAVSASSMCQEIDRLVREAVMDKMGELRNTNCSLQSRKPWRGLYQTRDLQEIMILAEDAKILVRKVMLQMLKTETSVMDEDMAAIKVCHSLTLEKVELLRCYGNYLEQQL